MINSLQEIKERFETIKDHKPKASKKLNELGDILASAYRIDAELANEMWQYIVDLNTADDIANSKFYVAQVFNKISDRISATEATSFVSMVPERVQQMVLYGYDGSKLWDCLEILIRGYIEKGSVDDAITCVDYFYEKFDGIYSDCTEVYRVARKVATICVGYIQNGENEETAEEILELMESSENQDINSIVEATKIIGLSGECDDYDMLFYVARKCKEPVEFFGLLWEARYQFSIEELKDKWVEYVEECEDDDIRPYNYIQEDYTEEKLTYKKSKLGFYVEMEKNESILLDYYFNRPKLYDVEKGVVCAWILDENWEQFIKYISQTIMASSDSNLDFALKNTLKDFMDACFKYNGIISDKYGRNYTKHMERCSSTFAEALSNISAITIGCSSHRSFHLFIKDFIQRLNGNVEILKDVGFEEKEEKRSPIVQLKEYIRNFNNSGQKVHDRDNMEYKLIMKQFARGLFDKKEINKARNEAYKMASNDVIATFFFTRCPEEYQRRKDMLSACVIKNDIDRALKLIEMMVSTKEYPEYASRNGWARQNMLTIKYLIQLYDYSKQNIIGYEANGITDEMRQTVKQLVEKMVSILPEKVYKELIGDLYKLNPPETKENKSAFDCYVENLLDEVDAYTTYLNTRKRGKKFDINKLNWEIGACFKKLSSKGRLDVIIEIMSKLAPVHDSLMGVTYNFHILDLVRGISEQEFSTLYNYHPDIFEAWINGLDLKDHQILKVAATVGSYCSKSDFMSFRNMILAHKGYIDGLDSCFKVTSENTPTQLLYKGNSIILELDYLKVVEHCLGASDNHVCNVIFRVLTTKKSSKIDSVRVTSCKINSIEVDGLGFICDFDDGGPRIGYDVDALDGVDELIIYPDFLRKHGIKHISKMEVSFVLMDEKGKLLERLSPIIVEHDLGAGGYKVTKAAERQE